MASASSAPPFPDSSCGLLLCLGLPAASHDSGRDAGALAKINANRGPDLREHMGIVNAARAHSQDMARDGGIGHDGANERVYAAAPDPAEGNGAPDDGFPVANWCENVTLVNANQTTNPTTARVAKTIYEASGKAAAHTDAACATPRCNGRRYRRVLRRRHVVGDVHRRHRQHAARRSAGGPAIVRETEAQADRTSPEAGDAAPLPPHRRPTAHRTNRSQPRHPRPARSHTQRR